MLSSGSPGSTKARNHEIMICLHCEEPILPGERHEMVMFGLSAPQTRYVHMECYARSIIGGVNHQAGRCTCCGGSEPPDPPGLTRRQAAQAAVRYWRDHEADGSQET